MQFERVLSEGVVRGPFVPLSVTRVPGVDLDGRLRPETLLDVCERLYGSQLHVGQIGFIAGSSDAWGAPGLSAGVMPRMFPTDAGELVSRLASTTTQIWLVGHGVSTQRSVTSLVNSLVDGFPEIVVRDAIVASDGLWFSHFPDGAQGAGERCKDLTGVISGVGLHSDADIFSRLFSVRGVQRLDPDHQSRIDQYMSASMKRASCEDRAELGVSLAQDLSDSSTRESHSDFAGALIALMQDPVVRDGIIAQSVVDKSVCAGLVRAARMSVSAPYSAAVWFGAAMGLWVYGHDDVGPVPSHVVARIIEPFMAYSPEVAHLHHCLVRGQDPEAVLLMVRDGLTPR